MPKLSPEIDSFKFEFFQFIVPTHPEMLEEYPEAIQRSKLVFEIFAYPPLQQKEYYLGLIYLNERGDWESEYKRDALSRSKLLESYPCPLSAAKHLLEYELIWEFIEAAFPDC